MANPKDSKKIQSENDLDRIDDSELDVVSGGEEGEAEVRGGNDGQNTLDNG